MMMSRQNLGGVCMYALYFNRGIEAARGSCGDKSNNFTERSMFARIELLITKGENYG